MSQFKDHFSNHAKDYAKHRPTYPSAFFEHLSGLCQSHDRVWDCATGNGQAALALAAHFKEIVATDASAEQIQNATPHPKITYQVCPAEETPFEDQSFDLITVAQAIHWFDHDRFYQEAKRVLKPNGLLAAWGYFFAEISPEIDKVVTTYWHDLEDSWPAERSYVNNKYSNLPFPLKQISLPEFYMQVEWSAIDYTNYLFTWSGTQRYIKKHGADFFEKTKHALFDLWGDPEQKKTVQWPMIFRLGRFSS